MNLQEFMVKQRKQEEEYQELVKLNLRLYSTIEQLRDAIEWCSMTFPELQEGGEYEECWKSIEDLARNAKSIAVPSIWQ